MTLVFCVAIVSVAWCTSTSWRNDQFSAPYTIYFYAWAPNVAPWALSGMVWDDHAPADGLWQAETTG